jgi:uncharacterized protein YxjI
MQCPKCQYVRKKSDLNPAWQCPACGIAYAKFETSSAKAEYENPFQRAENQTHSLLGLNQFFVKEHVGLFKASNSFDIFDPQVNRKIFECREPNLGLLTKLLRFTRFKQLTPFNLEIRSPEGELVISVERGISFLLSKVSVRDGTGRIVGHFKQRLFSIGGKFDVLNTQGKAICTLQGKWTGWDFRFMQERRELAAVSKKWSGLGKELFTTADNYMLSIHESVAKEDSIRMLIVAAVLCIDMVLKES